MSYRSLISLMPKTAPVDADAQAFLTAAGITDPIISSSINTLVVQLKADNIWTKMKALYPMVGGTASTHKWNLKDPRDLDAAYRLVFYGGVTHDANGITGNGTNGFADTRLSPSTQLSLNNSHLSFYIRTNNNGSGWGEMGCSYLNQTCLIIPKYLNSATSAYRALNSNQTAPGASPTDVRGLYIASRIISTSMKLYRNSSVLFNDTLNSGALFTIGNLFILSINLNGGAGYYSGRQCAFASIGDGLTDTEAANFYTAVQAFQTSLSRQV